MVQWKKLLKQIIKLNKNDKEKLNKWAFECEKNYTFSNDGNHFTIRLF